MKNPFLKSKGKTLSEFAKDFLNIQPAESDSAVQQEVSKTNKSVDEKLAKLQEKVESLESENAAFRDENEALKSAMSEIAKPDTNSIAKIRAAAQGFVTATAEGSTT